MKKLTEAEELKNAKNGVTVKVLQANQELT